MGAHLNFKLRDSVEESPKEINEWLNGQPEQEALDPIEHAQPITFWEQSDYDLCEEEYGYNLHDVGEGQVKATGTPSEAKDLWASLFQELHTKYDVAVLSSSCALTLDHLTHDQLRKITDNGNAISGAESEQERVRKLLAGQEAH